NGSNSYSGGTFVNAGTLLATNTFGSATGLGNVTVGSDGILGGTGIISGTAIINGGSINPGSSPGVLTIGSVTLNAGSTLNYELVTLSGTSDKLIVTDSGGLSISGSTTINI